MGIAGAVGRIHLQRSGDSVSLSRAHLAPRSAALQSLPPATADFHQRVDDDDLRISAGAFRRSVDSIRRLLRVHDIRGVGARTPEADGNRILGPARLCRTARGGTRMGVRRSVPHGGIVDGSDSVGAGALPRHRFAAARADHSRDSVCAADLRLRCAADDDRAASGQLRRAAHPRGDLHRRRR